MSPRRSGGEVSSPPDYETGKGWVSARSRGTGPTDAVRHVGYASAIFDEAGSDAEARGIVRQILDASDRHDRLGAERRPGAIACGRGARAERRPAQRPTSSFAAPSRSSA